MQDPYRKLLGMLRAFLQSEVDFLVHECGVDPERLGFHWALHQAMLGFATGDQDENDMALMIQTIGWH